MDTERGSDILDDDWDLRDLLSRDLPPLSFHILKKLQMPDKTKREYKEPNQNYSPK